MAKWKTKLNDDERANIRIRRAAGETMKALADDYDIAWSTVREICLSDEDRKLRNKKRAKLFKRRRNTPEFQARLRASFVSRYEGMTGRSLRADLIADSTCPSPHSSLPPPETNTATRKPFFNTWQ